MNTDHTLVTQKTQFNALFLKTNLQRRSSAVPPNLVCMTRRNASHRSACPESSLSPPCKWPLQAEQRELGDRTGQRDVQFKNSVQVCSRDAQVGPEHQWMELYSRPPPTHLKQRTWCQQQRSDWTSQRLKNGQKRGFQQWFQRSTTWQRGSWRHEWRSSRLTSKTRQNTVFETTIIKPYLGMPFEVCKIFQHIQTLEQYMWPEAFGSVS